MLTFALPPPPDPIGNPRELAYTTAGLKFSIHTTPAEDAVMAHGPISQFITHHYRHFNAATLVDAANAWRTHLEAGKKMLLAMGGAMSTGRSAFRLPK